MKYRVIIAEKPSVAKSIACIVGATGNRRSGVCGWLEGNGWQVTWAFGHLVELQPPEEMGFERTALPVMPERWMTRIRTKRGKDGRTSTDELAERQMKTIGGLFERAAEIVVATDAGREGELIFRYIYEYLGCTVPFRRMWISSLTDEAIRKGLDSLADGHAYDALSDAAHARSQADWLVGLNASRALRLATGTGENVALGRVQTPTLDMICARYEQFRNFVPQPFWNVTAAARKDGITFQATTDRFCTEAEARKATGEMTGDGILHVTGVEQRHTVQRPPLLHDLTSLQRLANSRLGLTAGQTLAIAQELYEKKLLSYPRTGSRYIPEDVMRTLPRLLERMESYGGPLGQAASALKGKRLNTVSVDGSKVTDHHALLPTGVMPDGITDAERNVYELVLLRLLESMSDSFEADVTAVTMECGGHVLRTRGSVPTHMGWKGIAGPSQAAGDDGGEHDGGKENDNGSGRLPPLKAGERLPLDSCEMKEGKTKPEPVFTDSTLLAEMETCGRHVGDETVRESMKDCGLGTPATRAQTIERLIALEYVRREGRKLVPTARGLQVWSMVRGRRIADAATTGEWERDLALIERGSMDAVTFASGIREFVCEVIADLKLNCKPLDTLQSRCPLCGHALTERRFSILCDTQRGGCGLSIPKSLCGKDITGSALDALLKGQTTAVIRGFTAKSGRKFDAAIAVDGQQRRIVWVFPDKEHGEAPATAGTLSCPNCGNALRDSGRSLSCPCGFTLWKSISGRGLSGEQVKGLLAGGTVRVTGMTGKSGRRFDADVTADPRTGKTTFIFDKR